MPICCARLPAGLGQGAPKHRALQVIAELEDRPRGVYTGAIGYASPAAGLEFSVAIRTAEIRGGQFSLGVGGGITVDSTPTQEWYECFDKARPLLAAIGGAWRSPIPYPTGRGSPITAGVCDTSLLRFGPPVERAEHLARLERSVYELYQRPLPAEAAVGPPAPRGVRTLAAAAHRRDCRRHGPAHPGGSAAPHR